MGRLLKLEFKRVFKMKATLVILLIAITMGIISPIMCVNSVSPNRMDKNRNQVEATGFSALEERRNNEKDIILNDENISKIYNDNEEAMSKYDREIPYDVFNEKVLKYYDVLPLIIPVISQETDINKNNLNFYNKFKEKIKESINGQFKEGTKAHNLISENVDKIETPFTYKSFVGWNQVLYSLNFGIEIIMFLCCIIAAQMFSINYQNNIDTVYRATRYGRKKLAHVKIITMAITSIFTYLLYIALNTITSILIFGYDNLNVPVQFLNPSSCAPFTLKDIYLFMFIFGLIAVCSISAITMFFSSILNSSMYPIVIAFIVILVPFSINSIENLPQFIHFIKDLLPSNVINLLDGLISGTNYFPLNDNIAVWIPHLMVIGSVFCFILFTALTIPFYSKRQIKR